MIKRLFALLLLLAACTPTEADRAMSLTAVAGMGGHGGAASLEQAAAYEATALGIRGAATRQAAIPTEQAHATIAAAAAVREATNDALAVRATAVHIDATATGYAIMAQATANAVGQLATVDARLVADEATRLALMRDAEVLAAERQWLVTRLIGPVVILVGAFVLIVAYMVFRANMPMTVPHGNHETFTPPRLTRVTRPSMPAPPEMEQLPAPVAPLLLPAEGLKGSIMIPATRGSGKTITLRQLVDGRVSVDGPQAVTVIDPHYAEGAWGLANVVAGEGEDVATQLQAMEAELKRRKEARRSGVRHFPPLTVAMEEMPVLSGEFGNLLLNVWKRWIWEGRKFGLNVIIVTQSTRVGALGIKGHGDLVEGFDHIIWLGTLASSEWPDITQGMARPAVIRSGHHDPRPLIVPYDPRKDSESDQFIPYFVGESGLVQPTAPQQLPFTAPQPTGLTTQWGYVTPAQVARILAMKRAGEANSRIETAVFNQNTPGGNAYHKVKSVLEMYG